jgi:hypothetical protein
MASMNIFYVVCSVCVLAQVGRKRDGGSSFAGPKLVCRQKLILPISAVTNTIKPVNFVLDSATTMKPLRGSSAPTSPSGFWIDTRKCRLVESQDRCPRHRHRLRGKDRATFPMKVRSRPSLHLVSNSFLCLGKAVFLGLCFRSIPV